MTADSSARGERAGSGDQPGRREKSGIRTRLVQIIEGPLFTYSVLSVIVINAITLGLATSPTVMGEARLALKFVDDAVLTIFILELSVKLFAYGWRFFLNGWNVFDAIVVSFGLLPATGDLTALRALRIVRAMRLLSVVPQMRQVIQALINSLPGMVSVMTVLGVIYYIFAVMATRLFGQDFDAWFGTIGRSFYSLFQIMTLESWSMGIVRPVMELYPMAWLLFVPFIIMTAFAVLNLFIGLLVNSMQSAVEAEREDDMLDLRQLVREENHAVAEEVRALKADIEKLRSELGKGAG